MIRGNNEGGDFAVGLDVGTTKICAISGKLEGGEIRILSKGSSYSRGLRKGIVVDAGLASASVRQAVKDAEAFMGARIRSVFVGIAGGHIKGFNGYGAISVKGGVVREEDVERLMDSAGAVCVPVDREILHVIPAGFRLDGNNGVMDPVGMPCERLEARVHIVTGSVASVRSLVQCCEAAGVEVSDIVLEPLASADAVLNEEEKKRGVGLVDIGGGTTDIAVYRDGILKHTAVLALGGNHITNDIAVGLGIPVEEAERIKKLFGHASAGSADGRAEIDIRAEDGLPTKVPLEDLSEIIQPRCEELLALISRELSGGAGSRSHLPVVLTGGTSLLRGIDAVAASILGVPVRIGVPGKMLNGEGVSSPEYATGVGLLNYGLHHAGESAEALPGKRLSAGFVFERMKHWVKGFFYS